MKRIILVSKCAKISKNKRKYHFKFRGVYDGNIVQSVILQSLTNCDIFLHEEYVLFIQLKSYKDRILFGEIVKVKKLDDFKTID